jgi:inositol transport system substrate-binding protein
MKKFVGIVVAVCLLWGMSAVAQDDVKGTIGFTFHSSRVTFQKILLDEFMKEAEKYPGIEVKVIDPQVDIERQLNAIETFIAQEVDVIVSSPLDFQGSIPGVEAANEAGIPYIAMNCTVGGGEHTYAGSSNLEAGQLQGKFLAEALPEGAKIVYLRGQEGMQHTMERREGIQLELLDKRPDVELLAEQPANYLRPEGMRVMEDWLQAFPEIDAVVAANDEMALGAIEALKSANRLEGVMVLGIDATPDAVASVRRGEMTMTVLQDAPGQARKAFELAVMALKGEELEAEYLVPFYPITLDNVDEYFPQ